MSHGVLYPPRVWPLRIVLDGHTLQYAKVATQKLLLWIASDHWPGFIIDSVTEEDRLWIWERLQDPEDELTLTKLKKIADNIITELAGTEHGAAKKIARRVCANWFHFDGWCITQGFDPNTAPVHRVISAGYAWWTASLDTTEDKHALRKLDEQLWPPDEEKSKAEEQQIMAQVMAQGMKIGEVAR